MNRRRMLLALVFLSITIAEFATGSTALTSIITDPGSFFLFSMPSLLGLYGCGVILIREASVAWGKSWPTVLLLGVAYGIMEEGVSVHTFFAPVNATVGVFGQYGKVLGLDLTWAIIISLFHAVYSIALPILITGLLWPEFKKKRLLGRRSTVAVAAAYTITVLILDIIAPYRPSLLYTAFLVGMSALIVIAGKRMPVSVFKERPVGGGRPYYFTLGIIFFPFIIFVTGVQTFLPYVVLDAEIVAVAILIYRGLESHSANSTILKESTLVAGLLVPLLAFGVIESIAKNPLGLVAVVALIYVGYMVLKAAKPEAMEQIQRQEIDP